MNIEKEREDFRNWLYLGQTFGRVGNSITRIMQKIKGKHMIATREVGDSEFEKWWDQFKAEEFRRAESGWTEKEIAKLAWRTAIKADRQRRGEPVEYQLRQRPAWLEDTPHNWTKWERCTAGQAEDYERTPFLHDWYYQVRRLYTSPQPTEPDVLPGEAIFGFSAWLTSLKTPVTFSECHGAAIGADLAAAYNTSQGFIQVREDFYKRLKPYPKHEPSQPAEPVKEDSDDALTVAYLSGYYDGKKAAPKFGEDE